MISNFERTAHAVLLVASGSAYAADVSFRATFEAAKSQDVVVVSVADDDVLVLDPGSYYSDGRKIVIAAKRAKLVGETRIALYRDEDKPRAPTTVASQGKTGDAGTRPNGQRHGLPGGTGERGHQGETGEAGKPGTSIRFEVQELVGDGWVTINASGQRGGKGQKGGQGGLGGTGADGRNRDCGTNRKRPGNGGAGGVGGSGGGGGAGGQGGAGGDIIVSAAMKNAIIERMIEFDLDGAEGGEGGDPGEKGSGGRGGRLGGGGSCGGGGDTGYTGSEGDLGVVGRVGPPGSNATVKLLYPEGAGGLVALPELKRTSNLQLPPKDGDCTRSVKMLAPVSLNAGVIAIAIRSERRAQSRGISRIVSQPSLIYTDNKLQVGIQVHRKLTGNVRIDFNAQGSGKIQSAKYSCPAAELTLRYSLLTIQPPSIPGEDQSARR